MAINIYTVQADAIAYGWELLSEEYKNLKTPLKWRCSKGHEVELTYEEWRKHHRCAECEKASGTAQRNIVPPKPDGTHRVLALDAATRVSGWAIYDNKKLSAYGTFCTNLNNETVEKIHEVKEWLLDMVDAYDIDAVGIEDIQYQKEHGVKVFKVLANLQGVLVEALFDAQVKYLLASSSTWRSYVGINHAEARESAKKTTQNWVNMNYHIMPTQDEADAIAMGIYFSHQMFDKKKINWGEQI